MESVENMNVSDGVWYGEEGLACVRRGWCV